MDFIIQAIVPLGIAVMGLAWYSQETTRRKIERYEKLIKYIGEFYKNTNPQKIEEFLIEYRISFMYCPDKIIKKINALIKLFMDKESKNDVRKEVFSDLIIEIRKDTFRKWYHKCYFKNTRLSNEDFIHVTR